MPELLLAEVAVLPPASLISSNLDRSAGSAAFSSRRSSSGTVGLPAMSMRLVSTLRTWITTPFGTARTFIVFGAMKRLSSSAPRRRASRSTRSSSFFGQTRDSGRAFRP